MPLKTGLRWRLSSYNMTEPNHVVWRVTMYRTNPHRVLQVAVLCQFLATTALYAQISNASINGTVRDATGAVVPESVVLLRNTATGVESRTVTNDQGIYSILNI